jgi:putative transposase
MLFAQIMSRPWRIEFEGALYHVLSRGNERNPIFNDDNDRLLFIEVLGEMSNRFDVDIFAYVLMDNHYHILLKTKNANLSKSMQWLGATYTRRFNNKYNRAGHLFQGRFKSFIVQNNYLMQLSCYIHRNPLRAGIVERLVKYPWSSYSAYAYGKKPPEWLNLKMILSRFKTKDRHRLYREKVQKYASEEKQIWENLRHGLFLGTLEFVDQIKSICLKDRPHSEIPQQIKLLKKSSSPEKLLRKPSQVLNCSIDKFRKSLRISEPEKLKRDLLIYLLWDNGLYNNQEIGAVFGLSYSSVSRRASIVRKKISTDKALMRKAKQLKSLIKM